MFLGQKPLLGELPDFSLFPQPTALFLFNEGGGDKVFDLSGNGNDGIITNAPWSGQSLVFNDTGYVRAPDNDSLDPAGDFTVGIWLRSDVEADVGARIFSKGNAFGAPGNGRRFEVFWITATDSWEFTVDDDSTKTNIVSDSGLSQVFDGKWHLWIFERDFGNTLKIFVDGNTEVGSGADNTGSIVNGSDLLIGAFFQTGTTIQDFWIGDIGAWSLWKQKLSGYERDLLFREQFPWFKRDPIELRATTIVPSGITILRRRRECA